MKISVITVCYNSAKTIESTILSVKNQTYQDIEYIVIDGGSSDQTMNIVKKYKSVVSRYISEKDNGLYDAMNKGIHLASGQIIALINSDDFFCDDAALEKVARCFEKNIDIEAVYADLYYVDQKKTNKIVRKWKTGKRKSFKTGWHPAHPTIYIKKSIYNEFGVFNLDFYLAADFEIMLRFLEKYKIKTYYLEEYLVKMRLGGATNKSIKNIIAGNKECIKAFELNSIKVSRLLYPIIRIFPKIVQLLK